MYTKSLANNLVNSKSVRTCMFSVCKFLNSSKMRIGQTVASWVLAVCCFGLLKISQSQVPPEEVAALQQIVTEMGATYWKFNGDQCEIEMVGITPTPPTASEGYVDCNCNFSNNTVCHITNLVLKGLNLPGVLPSNITKLPYLQAIDFAYNLLNGTIPKQWASSKLTNISRKSLVRGNTQGTWKHYYPHVLEP